MDGDWTDSIEAYIKLDEGLNKFDVVREPKIEVNQWGNKQVIIPTNLGLVSFSTKSPIAAALAKYKKQNNTSKAHLIVNRDGRDINTRYTLVSIGPISQQRTLSEDNQPTEDEVKERLYKKYLEETGQSTTSY